MSKEYITNSGKRFIYRDGFYWSMSGRKLTPREFKQYVEVYGGGSATEAKHLSENFVGMARDLSYLDAIRAEAMRKKMREQSHNILL